MKYILYFLTTVHPTSRRIRPLPETDFAGPAPAAVHYAIAALLLLLFCAPLRAAPVISVASRQNGATGAFGDADSGDFFGTKVRSPVADDSTVFFVSRARLNAILDVNDVFDVYSRVGDLTRGVSISGLPPDETVFGDARFVSISDGATRAAIIRPVNELLSNRTAFLWDLDAILPDRFDFTRGTIDIDAAAISGNGAFIAVRSPADGIDGGNNNGLDDIFLYDTIGDNYTLVSAGFDGSPANGRSAEPSIDGSGNRILFLSRADNLLATTTNGQDHVYIYTIDTGTAIRLNNRLDTSQPDTCQSPVLCRDGAFAAFTSADPLLVPDDVNGVADVFIVDTAGVRIERVSVTGTGAAADAASGSPAINRDGRFVAFTSSAENLVAAATDGFQQIYVRDRLTQATQLISCNNVGAPANANCFAPAMAPSGRYITFNSPADNLVTGVPSGMSQVYLVDLGEGFANRAPVAESAIVTQQTATPAVLALSAFDADGDPLQFSIEQLPASGQLFAGDSTDGADLITIVPFQLSPGEDRVTYLPANDFKGNDTIRFIVADAFEVSETATVSVEVGDFERGIIQRISTAPDSQEATDDSAPDGTPRRVDIDADGSRIAFTSLAGNLDAADANEVADVFVRDRSVTRNALVSIDSDENQGDHFDRSEDATMSPDGRIVAFVTLASFAADDGNSFKDVYMRDRESGTTSLLSRAISRTAGNGNSRSPSVDTGAESVAFSSAASNLTGTASDWEQIYLWRRSDDSITLISSSGVDPADADCTNPMISSDGAAVVFATAATNLAAGPLGESNIYVYWTLTGDLDRVTLGRQGTVPDGDSLTPAVSMSGRYVTYRSSATNLADGDTNGVSDIFVADLASGSVERVSLSADGTAADLSCFAPSISATGRFVYFRSRSTMLVATDTRGFMSGYLVDRSRSFGDPLRIRLVSNADDRSRAVVSGNGDTLNGALSATGRYLAFVSDASNLVPNDEAGFRDIFVSDFGMQVNAAPVPQTNAANTLTGQAVDIGIVAADAEENDLVVRIDSPPSHGRLEGPVIRRTLETPGPTFRYVPDPGFTGMDAFAYIVNDGDRDSAPAMIDIEVAPLPRLAVHGRLVISKTESEGVAGNDVVELVHPDFLDVSTAVLEFLNVPQHGTLTDRNGGPVNANNPIPYADVPLTYTPAAPTVFAIDIVQLQARSDDWETETISVEVVVGAERVSLPLAKGWNFISLPLAPVDTDPERLFRIDGKNCVFGPPWRLNAQTQSLERTDNVSAGAAVWVFALDDCIIADIPSGPANAVVTVATGWNGIGPVGESGERALPAAGDGISGTIWFWDVENQLFEVADRLQSGRGYYAPIAEGHSELNVGL